MKILYTLTIALLPAGPVTTSDSPGGFTPIDFIVMAATPGQNFDQLFRVFWLLTTLISGF